MKIDNVEQTRIEPITLRIPVINQSRWYKLLAKLKLKPASREFAIAPLSLAACAQVSKLLLEIQHKDFATDSQLLEANYELIIQHQRRIATIISLAVRNRKKRPGRQLINFFIRNLSIDDMPIALRVVQTQMNLKAFMESLIMLRGADILSLQTN